ncbi:MAG: protein kinase [Myxococcales bacterium]|nr:protein kinase [Myxococcales bacterium]
MRSITEIRTEESGRLGNYRILRLLGRGGMGDVYLGWSGLRLVAIKLLHAHYASDATFVAMFLAEAKVAGRINHTGIAQVLDVGVDGGRLYMVMEYVAGHNLDELITDTAIPGPSLLPLRIGAAVFAFVAQALSAAHRAQVVHRDISPHNILVSDTGAIKLIDFGIARTSSTELRTTPGTFRGRFGYMAPEYVQGQPCDHRVDLFALGVVMWETFARRRLYPGAAAAQLYAVIERPAERLDEVVPGFPEELATVVEKLLERDPEKRMATAAQVATTLEAMLPRLPDDGFRNLAHWVEHHLAHRIEARAHADTEELQRIELENADPDIEILPSATSAARYVGESSHTFSPVARPGVRSGLPRWLPAVALGAIGVVLLGGAIWMFASRSRPSAPSGGQAALANGPQAVPLVQPIPVSAPPAVAPPVTEPPVVETQPAPPPAVVTAAVPVPDAGHPPAAPPKDDPSSRKKKGRDGKGADVRAPDRTPSVAVIIAPRTPEDDPAATPVAPTPVAPTPVAPTLPTVPPPPPPVATPAAPPRTPRVPASMLGDEGAGSAVVGECNACHSKSSVRRVEGKQMTRSQWERFFRNGTHDRYLALGDRMNVTKLAAAKAFLSARALDASSDQGAGVR